MFSLSNVISLRPSLRTVRTSLNSSPAQCPHQNLWLFFLCRSRRPSQMQWKSSKTGWPLFGADSEPFPTGHNWKKNEANEELMSTGGATCNAVHTPDAHIKLMGWGRGVIIIFLGSLGKTEWDLQWPRTGCHYAPKNFAHIDKHTNIMQLFCFHYKSLAVSVSFLVFVSFLTFCARRSHLSCSIHPRPRRWNTNPNSN